MQPLEVDHDVRETDQQAEDVAVQPVGDDQRARIDERVARPPRLLVELEQGVERVARRLATDTSPDRLALGLRHERGPDFGLVRGAPRGFDKLRDVGLQPQPLRIFLLNKAIRLKVFFHQFL